MKPEDFEGFGNPLLKEVAAAPEAAVVERLARIGADLESLESQEISPESEARIRRSVAEVLGHLAVFSAAAVGVVLGSAIAATAFASGELELGVVVASASLTVLGSIILATQALIEGKKIYPL